MNENGLFMSEGGNGFLAVWALKILRMSGDVKLIPDTSAIRVKDVSQAGHLCGQYGDEVKSSFCKDQVNKQ